MTVTYFSLSTSSHQSELSYRYYKLDSRVDPVFVQATKTPALYEMFIITLFMSELGLAKGSQFFPLRPLANYNS